MIKTIPFLLITIYFLTSCGNTEADEQVDDALMGRFDSITIAQEKGPSTEYYYENMVQHISFPSKDSLTIYADIYETKEGPIGLLLCHQAGFSRGAYITTAMILSQLGYNAMAIDQRSGEKANNIENKTFIDAIDNNLGTDYIDAKQDIEAAIDYLYDCNGGTPIILVGSSYSASLCLIIGRDNPKVKAIAAFSPGEYLEGITVADELDSITKPIFVTSSKLEISQTSQLVANVDTNLVTHFKPSVEGMHGARSLWKETEGHKAYWNSFLLFLKKVN
jgi:pimeloyl-ACP methyl ester carboxylesterase